MTDYKSGDVVQLKSGGKKMTVFRVMNLGGDRTDFLYQGE